MANPLPYPESNRHDSCPEPASDAAAVLRASNVSHRGPARSGDEVLLGLTDPLPLLSARLLGGAAQLPISGRRQLIGGHSAIANQVSTEHQHGVRLAMNERVA